MSARIEPGYDGASVAVLLAIAVFMTLGARQCIGANITDTGDDRCTSYCVFGSIADPRRPRHDGGQVRYTPTGYECRCANLQAVKP
jgi:hypothetical protein